jgi:hypothetical protein
LLFERLQQHILENPNTSSTTLPLHLFGNMGNRVVLSQVTIVGHAITQPGTDPSWDKASIRHGTLLRAQVGYEDPKVYCGVALGMSSVV